MSRMDECTSVDTLFRAEFARLVRGLAVAYGRDAAADAVQEAFLSAHRHWNKVGALDDPAGWVRRVALNRLLNGRRNWHRRRAILDSVVQVAPEALSDELVDLEHAIAQLPERMRLAICLHHVSGFTVAEVATALGVAPGTIKSNLHDARNKLRNALKDTSNA